MSAQNGMCDKCVGNGKVEVQLFLSTVVDPCPLCKGDGKYIYLCPTCKKNKATLTPSMFGLHIGDCNTCFNHVLKQRGLPV